MKFENYGVKVTQSGGHQFYTFLTKPARSKIPKNANLGLKKTGRIIKPGEGSFGFKKGR